MLRAILACGVALVVAMGGASAASASDADVRLGAIQAMRTYKRSATLLIRATDRAYSIAQAELGQGATEPSDDVAMAWAQASFRAADMEADLAVARSDVLAVPATSARFKVGRTYLLKALYSMERYAAAMGRFADSIAVPGMPWRQELTAAARFYRQGSSFFYRVAPIMNIPTHYFRVTMTQTP
jgi:hypothetical protein